MSCCIFSDPSQVAVNGDYEEINVTQEFSFSKVNIEKVKFSVVDCKAILHSIPSEIFDLFTLSINVFSSEKFILQPCETVWIKTNIILKPYLPINCTFMFQGVVNGFAVKSSNQTLIQLNEEVLKVRVQNYNQCEQIIPIGMPIGRLVLNSKNFCEM